MYVALVGIGLVNIMLMVNDLRKFSSINLTLLLL